MALLLLFLALLPTAALLSAAIIRAMEPRSTWGSKRERGRWSLSPNSPLHRSKRPPKR